MKLTKLKKKVERSECESKALDALDVTKAHPNLQHRLENDFIQGIKQYLGKSFYELTNDCGVRKRWLEENNDVEPTKPLKKTKTLDGS